MISLYIQKIFPMNGAPVFYAFTACDSNWSNIFTPSSTVNFTVDDRNFTLTAHPYSRQIRVFPLVQNGYRVEFTLSTDLVNAMANAQSISIFSSAGKINYQLRQSEIKEIKSIIAQTHY